ncbi:unnamed protein product [Nesidiocoris tenuis]|uniref:Uncharacterized protein n=1 Tax=Nesidiocoris tenuis TaxID=355587 RepID=A0A6H5HHE4_9HEMI|nr:unnamed protein product [Nesidiocoris tenuis]
MSATNIFINLFAQSSTLNKPTRRQECRVLKKCVRSVTRVVARGDKKNNSRVPLPPPTVPPENLPAAQSLPTRERGGFSPSVERRYRRAERRAISRRLHRVNKHLDGLRSSIRPLDVNSRQLNLASLRTRSLRHAMNFFFRCKGT